MKDKDVIEIPGAISCGTRLDPMSAKRVARWMGRLFEGGASECIVDMTAVETLDSSGFGSFVSAVRRLGQDGGRVSVICNNVVRALFETAGVTRFITLVGEPA